VNEEWEAAFCERSQVTTSRKRIAKLRFPREDLLKTPHSWTCKAPGLEGYADDEINEKNSAYTFQVTAFDNDS